MNIACQFIELIRKKRTEIKNISKKLQSVNNSAFNGILLLKNRIYSMAFFESIELFAFNNSRIKLHHFRKGFRKQFSSFFINQLCRHSVLPHLGRISFDLYRMVQ
ncbi:hypothetical protein BpHYR1_024141 [Brachionus plicatilis]|uniref:Uncharacterized protein n=1 Tax=Brachionus plicatilis TaxID=10195 RepID=A0A3M7TCG5_BRAPC|nr:hypothetical protein BpHYR1_024141 [Brachionus plicatilis]